MKVTLLGTAAAEGWPALFCRCEACGKARKLRGKNIRTRSSALIDDTLKIDFPPDMLHQIIQSNVDLRCVTALLFTHAHDDHCAPEELQYRGRHFVPTPIENPLSIYGPVDAIRRVEAALDPTLVAFDLHTLEPWKTVPMAGYKVTPILAQHDPRQVCFNHIIQDAEGTTLLYATDTGWYEEPTWEFLQDVRLDGIVVEATKGMEEGGYMAHMSIPDIIRMREKLLADGCITPDCPIVTTHVSHLCGLMHDEIEALLAPHNILAGYDGMTLQIPAPTR